MNADHVREMYAYTQSAYRQVWSCIENLTDDDSLEATITYQTGSTERRDRRWRIIAHVINYGTDHRAQMLALLWQLGAPTVEQDFPIYFWSNAAP